MPITKIQNSGRQRFEKGYTSVSEPKLTKYGTQTQILTQPRKHDKYKSEINIKKSKYNFF